MSESGAERADGLQAKRRSLSFSTLVVMVSTALSRVLGFVRAAVVSFYFGGEGAVDVYNLVWMIPNNLRNLLAEGALSSAFIPTLSHSLVRDPSQKNAQKLIATLLGFQLLLLVPFLLACIVFADPIVSLVLPVHPDQHGLAVDIFRWIINYILLVSVSAILMAILNCHNRFAAPALAPLMFSITTIVSIVMFSKNMAVFSMVVGVISGGVLQIAVMLPSYRRIGYKFKLNFRFRENEEFRQVLRLWGPVVGTAVIFSLNEQIAVFFASFLGPGRGTAMTNALLFFQLPFGIFSASITTVLFPRMSRQIASRDMVELKETVLHGLKLLSYLLIPSMVVLMLLGHEIIALALQRGALFTAAHTDMASQVLFAYSLGLLTVSAARFLQRFFYASHNFRTPLASALLIVALDIVFSILLIACGFDIASLGYANSIASLAGFLWLFLSVRRSLKGLRIRSLLAGVGKAALASLPMAAGIVAIQWISGPWWRQGASWTGLLWLGLCGLWAAASVFAMYALMRVEVLDFLFKRRKG